MRIAIVEDDPHVGRVAELSLTRVGGMDVVMMASGEEFLERWKREAPDAVLLDLMLPGLDGPEVLARLREDPEGAELPVIIITARVQKHEAAAWLELGAVGVLSKPFDPMTLAAQVRELLEAAS